MPEIEFDDDSLIDFLEDHEDLTKEHDTGTAVLGLLTLGAKRARHDDVSKEDFLQAATAAWEIAKS